jgi:intracellular septation protein A
VKPPEALMSPAILLTQLLPLLVFLVVDAFVTDVRISILAAIVFAAGQLGLSWRRTRKIDWFVLLDVGLIVALGAVSILFEDELLFKLKPAILEGLAVLLLVALILAPDRFLLSYFGRLLPAGTLGTEALGRLRTMFVAMCLLVSLHAVAVIICALAASRRIWALVSGPGFYLVFLPFLAAGLLRYLRARRRI